VSALEREGVKERSRLERIERSECGREERERSECGREEREIEK
jgi:hypothetical protein